MAVLIGVIGCRSLVRRAAWSRRVVQHTSYPHMLPTIHEAAALIRAGKTSSRELLERCLANIDRHEDRVRAWVLVDRDRSRAEAKAADDELARGHDRGPLHGIPVAIKDIFDVFDWPTGCGSRLWANAIARQDAPVVA